MGRFNGHGHKISNVIVRESTEEVGFFGKSGGANSLVANVILESIDVRSTYEGDKDSNSKTGGLVGNAGIGNNGNGTGIANCIVSGYVDGQDAGGIAGYNNNAIKHCVNNAKVVGAKTAGGIVPLLTDGTVAHCVNTGEISLPNKDSKTCYAGGIVGVFNSTSDSGSILMYCANVGKCDGGAIIGRLQKAPTSRLTQHYWRYDTADKSIQSNDTEYTDEALSIDSYASVTDMPVVAALLDEVPYAFGDSYEPYYSGGIFTITPTLYSIGSNYAASAKISAKRGNAVPAKIIEANGKSTKIYVEALYHSGTQRPYLKIASGVDATPSKSYVKV